MVQFFQAFSDEGKPDHLYLVVPVRNVAVQWRELLSRRADNDGGAEMIYCNDLNNDLK
jgi:hypothetical protein